MIGEGVTAKDEEGEGEFLLVAPLLHLDPEFGVVLDVVSKAGNVEEIDAEDDFPVETARSAGCFLRLFLRLARHMLCWQEGGREGGERGMGMSLLA